MNTPLRILVAEDDVGDILLLRRAFALARVKEPIHFASDGQEVLDYLQGNPPFENPVKHPLPNLLLLDLNLPRMNGLEVLAWLQEQPGFRRLPVVVLSNSDEPKDVNRAYALGAAAYLVKPQDPNELVRIVERFQDYWRNLGSTAAVNSVPRLVFSA